MPNELWYWENRVPSDLIPAVKHVRDSFNEARWKAGSITHNCCYACLHLEEAQSPEIKEFASQLVFLKGLIGPSGSQLFNDLIERGTPSTILSAFFHLFEWVMGREVKTAFRDLLQIGSTNTARIETPAIEWSEWQVKSIINGASYQVGLWLKYCCDGMNIHANFESNDPDEEESVWTDWQAPRFARMQPSLGMPYVASRVYEREDVETSRAVVKAFKKYFVIHLEAKLKECVGSAHLELAKRPNPVRTNTVETQSVPRQDSQIATEPLTIKTQEPNPTGKAALLNRLRPAKPEGCFRTIEASIVLEVSERTINRKVKDKELAQGPARGTVTARSLKQVYEASFGNIE